MLAIFFSFLLWKDNVNRIYCETSTHLFALEQMVASERNLRSSTFPINMVYVWGVDWIDDQYQLLSSYWPVSGDFQPLKFIDNYIPLMEDIHFYEL